MDTKPEPPIVVTTILGERHSFDGPSHQWRAHDDGDLTIAVRDLGALVACFARGNWISVEGPL